MITETPNQCPASNGKQMVLALLEIDASSNMPVLRMRLRTWLYSSPIKNNNQSHLFKKEAKTALAASTVRAAVIEGCNSLFFPSPTALCPVRLNWPDFDPVRRINRVPKIWAIRPKRILAPFSQRITSITAIVFVSMRKLRKVRCYFQAIR